jgi:ABC-type transporter Mla subunit MlaD
MGAAAMIPYIGWAIAAIAVLSTFIGSDKTPAVGGNGLVNITGSGTIASDEDDTREKFFGDDRGYKGPNAGLNAGLGALGDQIAATAKLYGGNAEGLSIYGQTAQSPDGQGASGGTALYSKDGVQIFGSSFEGKNEELEANVALSMKRALLGGLKAADLAPEFAKVFEGYGENLGTLSEEQIASITAALEAVRSMNTMFDGLTHTFPELEKLGWEARTALTSFSGGLEALTTNIGSFYGTYYSESERMGDTLASMTEVFDGLNLKVPGTKDEFKSLVESLDLTTETGQKAYATLLGLNQTFAGWADYMANAAAGLKAVNTAFDGLVNSLPQVAALGQAARTALVDAFGSLDAMTSSLGTWQTTFYSASEQQDALGAQLRGMVAGLGLELPTTIEGYRKLAEAQLALGADGQKAYATLVKGGDDFAKWLSTSTTRIASIVEAARTQAQGNASEAMTILTNAVNLRKTELQNAFNLLSKNLSTSISDAESSLSKQQALADRLRSTLDSMMGVIAPESQRDAAKSLISNAAATGVIGDADAFDKALSVVAQPSEGLFTSFSDYQTDFLKTANDVAKLSALTAGQVSIEKQTVDYLKWQLETAQKAYEQDVADLDEEIKRAQASLDAANGTTLAVLSVKDAITNLATALLGLKAANANAGSGISTPVANMTAAEKAVYDAYKSSGIGYLDQEGFSFWTKAINDGFDPASIIQQIKDINNGKNNSAINGSHATGLDYVPFDGYVAELHRGERVQTAAEARVSDRMYSAPMARGASGGDSAEVAAELRALRQEVQGLRSEAQAIAKHTSSTAKNLQRVTQDGDAVTTREAATV